MGPPPRLFYYPISHYCVSAERMLAYKGIQPEIVMVPYHDKRELLAATGQDFVPALVDGERVVTWESIPDYLDGRQHAPTLSPAGQRGVARTLEHWGHQVLEERVWRAVVTEVPPVLTDDVERWVFEELQTRARGPWHVLVSRREEFVRDALDHLGRVEEMLQGRDWLLGDPSRADFGVYGAISPWVTVGHPIPEQFPHLRAWAARIRDL
jgi:glutathione S-transferase